VTELINKEPLKDNYPFIELLTDKNFYDYTIDDFKIHNMSGITKINSKLELAI
jgi:hypothetical protein